MSARLSLYVVEGDADYPNRPAPGPVIRPAPLMHFEIEQQTLDGPAVDRIVLWNNPDAKDCQFCSACNFMPGPAGQGMCVIRQPAKSGARTAT